MKKIADVLHVVEGGGSCAALIGLLMVLGLTRKDTWADRVGQAHL